MKLHKLTNQKARLLPLPKETIVVTMADNLLNMQNNFNILQSQLKQSQTCKNVQRDKIALIKFSPLKQSIRNRWKI